MTSIDPTGKLLAYLRQQTQEWRRQQPAGAGKPDSAQRGSRKSDKQDALSIASRQVAAIDKDDPQSRRKAFRIYLASLLMQEFGAGVANDPGFSSLVDRVQDTMEGDLQLKQSMDQAGDLLLKAAQAGKQA